MNLRYGARVQTAIEICVLVNGEKDSYVFPSIRTFSGAGVTNTTVTSLSLLSCFGLSPGVQASQVERIQSKR